jgi:hypothetical protein
MEAALEGTVREFEGFIQHADRRQNESFVSCSINSLEIGYDRSKGQSVSSESWTESEFLEQLARAIRETRAFLPRGFMDRILVELEDVEARLRNNEVPDETYLGSLAFSVIAVRHLETVEDEPTEYLDLVCGLQAYLDRRYRS